MNVKFQPKKCQNKNKNKKPLNHKQSSVKLQTITSTEFLNPQFKNDLSIHLKRQLQSKSWTLQNGKYFKQQWAQVFKNIKSTDVKILAFYKNLNQKIISQIRHVSFLDLHILELNKNKISNIEGLSMIDAPNLYHLSIAQNEISNLKSINKCHFPNLTCLNIFQNSIRRIQLRSIKAPILELIVSDDLQQKENNLVQFEDVSILCKLQIKKKFQTYNEYKQGLGIGRIVQRKILQMHLPIKNRQKKHSKKDNQQKSYNAQSFVKMMATHFYT